ncbi:DUF6705 family protein [Elizabethkingia meningoseptica]|uniref:DUF6705 family protein n=1 Tax=Elizabethkingia meningoseptica TaxID=238 RepID=UPI00301B5F1F
MKNLFFIIVNLMLSLSLKAQILPLNTYYTEITTNSYLKDLDNILPRYTGTWRTDYNGANIYLTIDNVTKHPSKFGNISFYNDVLFVRYVIKNSDGAIIQSTLGKAITEANIKSIISRPDNTIAFTYSGGDCGVGSGRIFLEYIDTTHLKWSYYPESSLIIAGECPQGSDLKVYLPKTEDLVFTKQ